MLWCSDAAEAMIKSSKVLLLYLLVQYTVRHLELRYRTASTNTKNNMPVFLNTEALGVRLCVHAEPYILPIPSLAFFK